MNKDSLIKDKILWFIFIFAAVYIIANIGTGSLTTWDEAIYANVSKEMLKTGNWIPLHLNGKPWVEKPPLYMWLTAFFYKLLGVSEFATRITSAIFGVGTVLLLYIFVKQAVGRNTAVLSALLLLASPHYLHFAKMGMLDVSLTFFILLMVYFYWLGEKQSRYLFLSGLLLTLGYFIKGFAVLLGPAIIFVYSILSGKARLISRKQFILGLSASIMIIALWYIIQYIAAGSGALSGYFNYHVYQRAISAIEEHKGGINFYQKAIFNKNQPWSVIMYISFLYVAWRSIRKRDDFFILLSSWIIVTYVLFSLLGTKLHWYIIPIYPALASASGILLERIFRSKIFIIEVIIVMVMLAQVRFSWAFDLDLNPEVKKAAIYARDLSGKGEDVYLFGGADAEIFYCDFATVLDEKTYRSALDSERRDAICIILPRYLQEASLRYNFDYKGLYESERISLYRIRFR